MVNRLLLTGNPTSQSDQLRTPDKFSHPTREKLNVTPTIFRKIPDSTVRTVGDLVNSSTFLDASKLALATLGISLLSLTLFGSLAWHGTLSLFAMNDQAHLISLATSSGLAACAFLSKLFERFTGLRHGHCALFSLFVAGIVSYLLSTPWPIAICFYYIDLSKVLAIYAVIAFVPSLIASAPTLQPRAGQVALTSFGILSALVLYLALR